VYRIRLNVCRISQFLLYVWKNKQRFYIVFGAAVPVLQKAHTTCSYCECHFVHYNYKAEEIDFRGCLCVVSVVLTTLQSGVSVSQHATIITAHCVSVCTMTMSAWTALQSVSPRNDGSMLVPLLVFCSILGYHVRPSTS